MAWKESSLQHGLRPHPPGGVANCSVAPSHMASVADASTLVAVVALSRPDNLTRISGTTMAGTTQSTKETTPKISAVMLSPKAAFPEALRILRRLALRLWREGGREEGREGGREGKGVKRDKMQRRGN